MNRYWRIVLWVLFWYYLAPYYLFKNYVFKKHSHRRVFAAVCSALIVLLTFNLMISSSNNHNSDDHVVVKKVGIKELSQARAKHKVLVKEESQKQAEYKKLNKKLKAEKKQAAKDIDTAPVASEPVHTRKSGRHHAGNMNTASSRRIVGNGNSKIYHVPGQAGYRMNSKNAVYFNSEQAAINAGYRKAKR